MKSCGCPLQRPGLVRRQPKRKWGKTHCERHCERKDAPKQRELCDESQPLGVSLRREAADGERELRGARQKNCTSEDQAQRAFSPCGTTGRTTLFLRCRNGVFSYQNAPPIPAEGWAFLLRSSRGGVSRLLSIEREGFADPFRPSLFMANRKIRCTTAAASCAETCCVPACPSGIIMVSFCKEVDPCEI